MRSKGFGSSARTALVYVLLAALWIFVSDRLLSTGSVDSDQIARLLTFKEWVFVAATGYGLFALLSSRGRSEEALRVAHANYRSLFENATVGIFQSTPEGRFLSVNPATARIFGYTSPEVMLGNIKSIADQIYLDPAARDEFHRLIVEQGQVQDFTYQARRQDGGIIWVHEDARLVTGPNGGVLHYEGFMTDVTERKRAEEALQESQARYRAVTESASDAIISSDGRGHIVGWNLAAETIFGYCASEAIGQPLTIIMPSAWQHGHAVGLARLQGGSQPRVVGRTIELEGRRKDGSQFPVEFSLSDWQVADEHFYTAVLRDITERKRGEEELRRAKEALETTNVELQRSLAREETLARTDGLTGLYNRVYFDELATREFQAAVRYERALAVMMIDVDHFKRVNDTLGHAAGDEVLALIGRTAAAHTRAPDVMARLGGDEFILLLPETTAEQALPIADRIVAGVAATTIRDPGQELTVTLSAGISELRREPLDTSVEQVVQRADKALYQAKAAGRNRTRLFDSATEDGAALNKGRHAQ